MNTGAEYAPQGLSDLQHKCPIAKHVKLESMHRWGSLEQLQSERTRRESLRLEREIASAKNQTAGVGVESVVHDLHRSLDGAEYNTAHESAREASGILARMLEGGGIFCRLLQI